MSLFYFSVIALEQLSICVNNWTVQSHVLCLCSMFSVIDLEQFLSVSTTESSSPMCYVSVLCFQSSHSNSCRSVSTTEPTRHICYVSILCFQSSTCSSCRCVTFVMSLFFAFSHRPREVVDLCQLLNRPITCVMYVFYVSVIDLEQLSIYVN